MRNTSLITLFSGLIFLALAQTNYQWNSVAIGGGGFVSAVIPSKAEKNLLFARTDVGGAYRWRETDQTWIPLTDWVNDTQTGFLGVEAIALDPRDANRVYMLVGISYFNGGKTAVLRSNDKGNTFAVTEVTGQFKAHGNGMGRQNGERMAVDPNLSSTIFCGTRANGLFKSTDFGATWNRVQSLDVTTTSNENGISFVLFDATTATAGNSTQTIYVGVSRSGSANLYRSTNGGTTWTAVPGAITTHMPQRAVLATNGMLYVTYGNGAGPHGHWSLPEPMDNGSIQRYDTKNNTWSNVTPTGVTRAFGGISVDASNPQRLLATTINTYMQQPWGWGDRMYLSTNGGSSWTDLFGANRITMDNGGITWIPNHAIHWAGSAEIDPFEPERAFVTSGNGIFGTSNLSSATSTWKFLSKGIEETVPLDMASIPNGPMVSVIGDYDGFMHTDLSVYRPQHAPQMGTTTGLAVAGANTQIMARVGNKIYRTANGGGSWTEVARPAAAGTAEKGRVGLSADGQVLLYSPEGGVGLFRTSVANGSTWTTVTGLAASTVPVGDPVNADKFYAYAGGTFYVSTNKGVSFSSAQGPGGGGSGNIRTLPGREGDVWVALNSNGLSRSTNAGTTAFAKIATVNTCSAVGFGKAAEGANYPTIYIWGSAHGGVVGIWRSTDQGANWVRVNDDLYQYGGPGNGQFVMGDWNVYGRVYMSTAGRGIIYGEPITGPVGLWPRQQGTERENPLYRLFRKGGFGWDLRGRRIY